MLKSGRAMPELGSSAKCNVRNMNIGIGDKGQPGCTNNTGRFERVPGEVLEGSNLLSLIISNTGCLRDSLYHGSSHRISAASHPVS